MMVDVEESNAAMPYSSRLAVWLFVVVGVAALGWWVVSVNQVGVVVSPGAGAERVVVELPNPESLLVTITPSRRTDGTEVFVDGRRVAHPAGLDEGQLLVLLGRLEPGLHEIEIRVPRPTWIAATVTIEVEVLAVAPDH